jgi:hypothetical protein
MMSSRVLISTVRTGLISWDQRTSSNIKKNKKRKKRTKERRELIELIS